MAFENQVACGTESQALLGFFTHGLIQRVRAVLLIHDACHSLQGFAYGLFGNHAVLQPIGNMLTGNAQCGAIFHQSYMVNVRNLGAANALVNPAHDIAQYALNVVIQFRLNVGFTQVFGVLYRAVYQRRQRCGALLRQNVQLYLGDIDRVIVHGMQGGSSG